MAMLRSAVVGGLGLLAAAQVVPSDIRYDCGATNEGADVRPGQQCGKDGQKEPNLICNLVPSAAQGTYTALAQCWDACKAKDYPSGSRGSGSKWMVQDPENLQGRVGQQAKEYQDAARDKNIALQLLVEEIQTGKNLMVCCGGWKKVKAEGTDETRVCEQEPPRAAAPTDDFDWCPLATACGGIVPTSSSATLTKESYGSSGGTAHSRSIPDQRGICVLDSSGPYSRVCKDPCDRANDYTAFSKGGIVDKELQALYATQIAKCPGINWWLVILVLLVIVGGCIGGTIVIRRNPMLLLPRSRRQDVPLMPVEEDFNHPDKDHHHHHHHHDHHHDKGHDTLPPHGHTREMVLDLPPPAAPPGAPQGLGQLEQIPQGLGQLEQIPQGMPPMAPIPGLQAPTLTMPGQGPLGFTQGVPSLQTQPPLQQTFNMQTSLSQPPVQMYAGGSHVTQYPGSPSALMTQQPMYTYNQGGALYG